MRRSQSKRTIFGVAGALIVFLTSIARDALKERYKDIATSIESAEYFVTLQGSLNEVVLAQEREGAS